MTVTEDGEAINKNSKSQVQTRQNFTITKDHRTAHNGHHSAVVWLYGLSGSGKSTIANALEKRLFEMGNHTYCLDGDNIRLGLNKDLGFSAIDRLENVRRVAEVAKLMADAGLIVIVSLITPYEEQRKMIRMILKGERILEVYVKCDLETCEQRDPKGLYKKARAGEIQQFTGISDPFEEPLNANVVVDTPSMDVNECVLKVAEELSLRLKG
jgi:adenylylsulfate kinase